MGLCLGSPRGVSRGSLAQEEIWLKLHKNRGRGSISMEQAGNSKGQHTKKAKMVPADTIAEAQRERAEGRGVRMKKHIKFLLL